MFNPMSLEGKRVLVTGASSGIGRACAEMASALGALVVLTGRRPYALEETLRHLTNPDAHVVCPGDITDSGFLTCLAEKAGKIDGLVHAAGISLALPVRMTDADAYRRVFETNAGAFSELMRVFANRRRANPGFSSVAISSVAALAGWSGVTAYAGSKGAVNAMVRALAVELASFGFRVNAVCPSNIRTPMLDDLFQNLDEQNVLSAILAKQPLGIGAPEQVASAVCFLLSSAANFITGVCLPVDGGYMAQ